jgi:hypothetical protein
VQFTVAVRNTGNIAVTLAVTNDLAPACDFAVTGDGLAKGAAQTRQCVVRTPASGALTNTARFSAKPGAVLDDPGEPVTGQAAATVRVSGTAAPGTTPGTGSGTSDAQTGVGGPETAGTTPDAKVGKGTPSSGSGKLASTGMSVVVPAILGATAVLTGGVLVAAGSRRRREVTGAVRWTRPRSGTGG